MLPSFWLYAELKPYCILVSLGPNQLGKLEALKMVLIDTFQGENQFSVFRTVFCCRNGKLQLFITLKFFITKVVSLLPSTWAWCSCTQELYRCLLLEIWLYLLLTTIASNSLVQALLYGCYFFRELIVLMLNLTDFFKKNNIEIHENWYKSLYCQTHAAFMWQKNIF